MGKGLGKKNQFSRNTKVWLGIRPRRRAGDERGEKSRKGGRVGMIVDVENCIACPTNLDHSIIQLSYLCNAVRSPRHPSETSTRCEEDTLGPHTRVKHCPLF